MFSSSSSFSLRPDVIELNFPTVIHWSDSAGRPFRSSSLWIFDGKGKWRLPGTSFRLAFVTSPTQGMFGVTSGRWCINDGTPVFDRGLFTTALVPHSLSPTTTVPTGIWTLNVSNGRAFAVASSHGPVSCREVSNESVCKTLESFITGNEIVGTNDSLVIEGLKLLVVESMSMRGLFILPWMKANLLTLLRGPLQDVRIKTFEFVVETLHHAIGQGLIWDQDQALTSSAQDLVRVLLSMQIDWRQNRRAQSFAMNILAILCQRGTLFIGQSGTLLGEEASWKHVILSLSAPKNVVSFVADATAATLGNDQVLGASNLLCELLSQHTHSARFATVFNNSTSSLRRLIRSLLRATENRQLLTVPVVNLVEKLRKHPHTAQLFQEIETGEPEWWLNLCEDDRAALNDEADDCIRCVITAEIMRCPVVLVASGELYERSAILQYLNGVHGQKRDPRTNKPIGNDCSVVPLNTLVSFLIRLD